MRDIAYLTEGIKMALFVILICLAIQRYGKFNSYSRQLHWIEPYFKWMTGKVGQIMKGHGLIGAAILILPFLVGIAIIFALVSALLGDFGYFILSVVLLWYCLDARDIRKEPYEDKTSKALFITTYRNLFGVIFWFSLFGPVGLSLYIIVVKLGDLLVEGSPYISDEFGIALGESLHKILAILDWIPVRLLGLSYALVGHFGSVFKSWLKKLSQGLSNTEALVAEWGMIALQQGSTSDISSAQDVASAHEKEAISLIDRSLLVWLIVIFLITFGIFLG